ncbi:MAG: hypothetical protein K2X66_05860 [Cyanobacteria bacterium]|nr:hypothetical protein [Cyanobacteriota bacterium]
MIHSIQPMKHQKGQSLSETALVIGLVSLVAIPVLLGMGQLGNQQLASIQTHQDQFKQLSSLASTRPPGNYVINVGSAIPGTQPVELTLQDGSKLSIPNFPNDMGTLVETMGPNGATELYNNTIRQIGMRLLSEGKITPEQANQFSNLANSGHGLAQVAKFYEDASSQLGMNPSEYTKRILPYLNTQLQNKRYTSEIPPDIRSTFGISNDFYDVAKDSQGFVKKDAQGNYINKTADPDKNYVSAEHADFIAQYTQLKQTGALADPALNLLITSLSKNIISTTISTAIYGNRGALAEYQFDPKNLKSKVASEVHANAVNICAAGDGKDSGVYCPPGKSAL